MSMPAEALGHRGSFWYGLFMPMPAGTLDHRGKLGMIFSIVGLSDMDSP